MKEPVIAADGKTYEKAALKSTNHSPVLSGFACLFPL